MAVTAIISVALITIVVCLIISHNHVTMYTRHLMRTPLLAEGSGKTGHRTL